MINLESKFRTKKWVEIYHDYSRGMYNTIAKFSLKL